MINRTEADIIIKKFNIKISGKYEINIDGRIDVHGGVDIRHCNLNKIPLAFGRIDGDFKCTGSNLRSLKNAPSYVSNNFTCDDNLLTSLRYGPIFVGGNYDCSRNKLNNLIGCATEIGRDLVCKMNKLKSLAGSSKQFFGRFNCSYNLLNNFIGAPEDFRGEIYANYNYLKNLKGFKKFDGILFIDTTASSVNTGDEGDYKNMKIELRLVSKFGYEFLPRPIIDNHHYLGIILKYQRYYEIWSDEDELNLDYFQMFIEDIKDGLL